MPRPKPRKKCVNRPFMSFKNVCSPFLEKLWTKWALSVPAPRSPLFKISNGGLGKMAVATANISANTFIGRYHGEVAERTVSPNYTIDLGKFNFSNYGKSMSKTATAYVLDGSSLKNKKHNITFFNHSCKNFNCYMMAMEHSKLVYYRARGGGVLRSKRLTCSYVAAFASRDIKKGEELLFNYDSERLGAGPFYFDTKTKQLATLKKSPLKGTVIRCKCEARCPNWFIQY